MGEVQVWWESIGPEYQMYVKNGGIVLAALVLGHITGSIVTRILTSRNFDAVLGAPNSAVSDTPEERRFTASFVMGVLVRLSIWAGAGWWLAQQSGKGEWASTILLLLQRTWAFACVLLAALALGSLVARRLVACLGILPGSPAEPAPIRNSSFGRLNPAGVVSAGSYLMVFLLVLLTAADMFNWPLTRSAGQALWQFAQHALIAAAALFLGCLGARWAQDMVTASTDAAPEKRAGQYTALGIMAVTTILGVAVLLSSAHLLLAVATLALSGFGLYLVRGYVPDVTAGMQLRSHKVQALWFEGESWQVADIGLISTLVGRRGEFHRVQNRVVLELCMNGAPAQPILTSQQAPAAQPVGGRANGRG
jgi:hypothetical protein